ncbi:MAG: protein kinase [Anaerolineales bacterium]|nr:protein kinase [Anaerolineales bacterium]
MIEVLNDRYQLDKQLGEGGMAIVYQASDLMLERTIAVKILRKDFSKSKAFQERFKEEARAAANLTHPNIVTVHDFGFDNDRLFIVMEHVPGTDLKQIIKKSGALPADHASRLFIQACAGIGYAHRAGLVHCDIKPHNMLVTPDHRLKVTDFGIARALASVKHDEQSQAIWGSPAYFSPEQAAGRAPSPASDVYSLGIVLFEMLTGELPFTDPSPQELALLHRYEAPPSAREMNPEISAELEEIIVKVLSKEPSSRYRTADQLGRIVISFTEMLDSQIQVEIPAPLPEDKDLQAILNLENKKTSKQWLTILLGLLSLITVGGLIPFWIWVYFELN